VTDAGHPASWGPVTGAASHLDFFNTRYGEIVVCKYEDLNGDGCLSAGEKAAGTLGAGWTFFLDANGNGAWDAGEQKASTDETGCVTFTGIEIGRSYKVYELPGESPAASGGNGWYQTVGKDGIAVSVAQSGGTARADFGNTEYGKLVVTKYVDRNNDGDLNDKGEGNPYTGHGFTFRLKDLTTGQVVATITDGQDGALDGKVTFTGLIVGHKYKVIEVLGAGSPWFQTGSTNTCFKIDYSGECEQASFVNSRYEGLTPGYWKNHPDASKNPWPRRGLI
jgi:uncharacterized protein (DUF2141 family)